MISIAEKKKRKKSDPKCRSWYRVNSKAQLRVDLHRLLRDVPRILHAAILRSRYYAVNTHSLLIQSDDSRKQSTNRDDCHRKLFQLLRDAGKETVPGETSDAQREKVKRL